MKVILDRCTAIGVEPALADGNMSGSEYATSVDGHVDTPSLPVGFPPSRLGLVGKHQVENAAIAARLAEQLSARIEITDEAIMRGLEGARHAGRIEYEGRYLFDGAHNIGGARALAAYLDEFEQR